MAIPSQQTFGALTGHVPHHATSGHMTRYPNPKGMSEVFDRCPQFAKVALCSASGSLLIINQGERLAIF